MTFLFTTWNPSPTLGVSPRPASHKRLEKSAFMTLVGGSKSCCSCFPFSTSSSLPSSSFRGRARTPPARRNTGDQEVLLSPLPFATIPRSIQSRLFLKSSRNCTGHNHRLEATANNRASTGTLGGLRLMLIILWALVAFSPKPLSLRKRWKSYTLAESVPIKCGVERPFLCRLQPVICTHSLGKGTAPCSLKSLNAAGMLLPRSQTLQGASGLATTLLPEHPVPGAPRSTIG